ncbi:BnaA06g20070D [Brassica napus]|uniref:BnaA06g20070D protein n=1 Tax=Brassica napus TaxID=3708 RepID=A0A078FH91_BRANA|nr:BnaA06g20070D [Brassica napus]
MPVPDNYSRADIDDMVHGIYRDQEMSLDESYKRLDDVYYPINNRIDRLTVRMDELKEEIYMIQRQNAVRSKDYPSIDGHTRPTIDTSHAPFRGKLVTVKLLEDKLDEINFSQDLLKEDISHRLEDNNSCQT